MLMHFFQMQSPWTILLSVLAINLMGDGLRDALDLQLKTAS